MSFRKNIEIIAARHRAMRRRCLAANHEFTISELKVANYIRRVAKKKGIPESMVFIRPLRDADSRAGEGLWLSAEDGVLLKCFGLVPVSEAYYNSFASRLAQSMEEKLQRLKSFRNVTVEPYDSGTIHLYINNDYYY